MPIIWRSAFFLVQNPLKGLRLRIVFVLQNHLVAGVWREYDWPVVGLLAGAQSNVAKLGAVMARNHERFAVKLEQVPGIRAVTFGLYDMGVP